MIDLFTILLCILGLLTFGIDVLIRHKPEILVSSKIKKKFILSISGVFSIVIIFMSLFLVYQMQYKLNLAEKLIDEKNYVEAIEIYEEINAKNKLQEEQYIYAMQLYNNNYYID